MAFRDQLWRSTYSDQSRLKAQNAAILRQASFSPTEVLDEIEIAVPY